MAAQVTLANISDAVKEYYQDGAPADLTERPHPGYAMLKKTTWKGGSPWNIGLKYGNTHGKSKVFATAQSNVGKFVPKKFAVTRVKDYAIAQLDGETILATRSDAASFFDALTTEVDSAFATMGNVMAREMYQDGTGVLATMASSSGGVVTLTNAADVRHFEAGMKLSAWDTSGGVLATDSGSDQVVSSVDTDAGTVTFPADISTWSSNGFTVAAGDGLGYDGDLLDGGASLSIVALAGLEAWNPASTGGTLFGLTQSDAKLCGSRYDATTNSQTYREAITDACAQHMRANGRFDYIAMHPENWAEFEKELDTKVEVIEGPSHSFGFRMLRYHAPWGEVKVYADPDCTFGVARGVDFANLELRTLEQAGPMILDYDGLQSLRLSGEDSIELRIGYYGNIGCFKPNNLARIILPAAS